VCSHALGETQESIHYSGIEVGSIWRLLVQGTAGLLGALKARVVCIYVAAADFVHGKAVALHAPLKCLKASARCGTGAWAHRPEGCDVRLLRQTGTGNNRRYCQQQAHHAASHADDPHLRRNRQVHIGRRLETGHFVLVSSRRAAKLDVMAAIRPIIAKRVVRVLVVEDERTLAATLARGLRSQGMAVDVAFDGRTALDIAIANEYDVVVLDRSLPVITGDAVCRELAGGTSRILMLTASGTISNRVEGLNLGADDYLGKPFSFDELVARIRALARRVVPALPPVLSKHDIELDPARHSVLRSGRPVELTPKEFAVLHALLAARGSVVAMERLIERVWDDRTALETNAARIVVSNLRRKLGPPSVIQTISGVGYKI